MESAVTGGGCGDGCRKLPIGLTSASELQIMVHPSNQKIFELAENVDQIHSILLDLQKKSLIFL